MPVPFNSRYSRIPNVQAPDSKGVSRPAIGLRPPPATLNVIVSQRLIGLDSIESLAARHFRNSSYWWRIADANPLRFPLDWSAGDSLALPSDVEVGRVERKSRF